MVRTVHTATIHAAWLVLFSLVLGNNGGIMMIKPANAQQLRRHRRQRFLNVDNQQQYHHQVRQRELDNMSPDDRLLRYIYGLDMSIPSSSSSGVR